jgi:hypothetical protein
MHYNNHNTSVKVDPASAVNKQHCRTMCFAIVWIVDSNPNTVEVTILDLKYKENS